MSFLRPRLLRTILLLLLGGTLITSNGLTWYLGQDKLVDSFRSSYFDKIFWVTESTQFTVNELIQSENWAGLEVLLGPLGSNKDIVYIFIRNLDDEIVFAFDDEVVEEYDPEIINWDIEGALIHQEIFNKEHKTLQSGGLYTLRDQKLIRDSIINGELRGKRNEVLYESRKELLLWGEPLGVMYLGFSKSPLNEIINESRTSLLIIELALLIIGLSISFWVSGKVAKPLEIITQEQKLIQELKLDSEVEVKSSILEVESLSKSLSTMKSSLRNFQVYMPSPELVKNLIRSDQNAALGGDEKNLTILFTDIIGFTSISENIKPEELMLQLSEYLGLLATVITQNSGTVDKFLGDGVMAFWGAPVESKKHANECCHAAIECQEAIADINRYWNQLTKFSFQSRIGIHTGNTLVGNLGSEKRMNYTVIGDSVNLASRLEGVNKIYNTKIIASGETVEATNKSFLFRPLDIVRVKGRSQGVELYELFSSKSDASEEQIDFCYIFGEGISRYRNREFEKALRIFNVLKKDYPDDKPIDMYIRRCTELKGKILSDDWSYINNLDTRNT